MLLRTTNLAVKSITVKLGDKELFGNPKIVPYPYEVNWQIGRGKWFLTPICSLSNHSSSPSFTIMIYKSIILWSKFGLIFRK